MADTGSPQPDAPLDRALAFIEAQLSQPLTVALIAAASGLSSYHFSRLFTGVRGRSVMAYVWSRRLRAAASRLADDPSLRLIDLAFDHCFESQEAFTRAFRREFGVAPGEFKRAHFVLQQRDLPMADDASAYAANIAAPERKTLPAFRVAGLSGTFNADTRGAIPALWQRFAPFMAAPVWRGYETYGLCWSMSPEQDFHYMAAMALADSATPAGLEEKEVPAQTYLVFRQTITADALHPQIAAATDAIWGRLVPGSGCKLSGGPDFEFYPADFEPNKPTWLAYYIPIEA